MLERHKAALANFERKFRGNERKLEGFSFFCMKIVKISSQKKWLLKKFAMSLFLEVGRKEGSFRYNKYFQILLNVFLNLQKPDSDLLFRI